MLRTSFRLSCLIVMAKALLFPSPSIMAADANTLTPQEQAAGWRLLFDGRSTANWHTYGKTHVANGSWRIEDGCLVLPKGNGRPNGHGGDLVTDAKYTNFEFSFEWRVGAGGNSGVEYLFTEGEKRPANFYPGDTGESPVGFEYQVLDDAPHAGNAADRLAASIYSLITPVGKTLRPVGEFNQGRIVVDGNHVEHWLNGRKVAECELGSAELQRIIASSKYKPYPGVGVKRATAIALQDHGAEVAYRNLKIRELRTGAGSGPAAAAANQPPPSTMAARKIAMQTADWRVWCWSKADNRWIEHPLEKMSVQIANGVLTARNTTNDGWPRAILVYRGTELAGDFIVSAEYRGQLESFDLQAADGANQRVSCMNPPQDSRWRSILLGRKEGRYAARIEEASAPAVDGKASSGMKCYFCFKLRPGEAVEVRGLVVQAGK